MSFRERYGELEQRLKAAAAKMEEAKAEVAALGEDLQGVQYEFNIEESTANEQESRADKAEEEAEDALDRVAALENLLARMGLEGFALEYALASVDPVQGLKAIGVYQ